MPSRKRSPSFRSPDSADRSPAPDPPRHSRCPSCDRQWKRAAHDSAQTLLPGSPCAWLRPSLIFLLLLYCKPRAGQKTTRGESHLPVLSCLLYEPLSREACKVQRKTRGKSMQHILVTGGAGRLGRLGGKEISKARDSVRGVRPRAQPGEGLP